MGDEKEVELQGEGQDWRQDPSHPVPLDGAEAPKEDYANVEVVARKQIVARAAEKTIRYIGDTSSLLLHCKSEARRVWS